MRAEPLFLPSLSARKTGTAWIRPFPQMTATLHALEHLSADLAGSMGRGVDVEVPASSHEVGGLGFGQRGRAFDRTRDTADYRHHDGGILVAVGRPVEMGGRGIAG